MITRIEARNYKCLRKVDVSLRPFEILVGPNGSGKTAFMDVIGFLRDYVSFTVQYAVKQRADNFQDLVWGREETNFNLGVEAQIPQDRIITTETASYTRLRYDLSVRLDVPSEVPVIENEKVVCHDPVRDRTLPLVDRTRGRVKFAHEDSSRPEIGSAMDMSLFDSAIKSLPTGTNGFPAIKWFATLISEGIRDVRLNTEALHKASTIEAEKASKLTGANLARSVLELRENSRESFEAWIRHLRTALPDLETVRAEPLPRESARRLMLKFQNGIEVPSRVVSDGTLCLMALTILAYMPEANRVYLIEEPENAVHPTAVETIYQSLSSLYDDQVLMASHSPILLSLAKPEELLCFTRTARGTEIVPGNDHPALREWKGEVNLSELFAAGVLG
jgi:predicted ATPase